MRVPEVSLQDLRNLRLTVLVVKRHKPGVVGVLFYGTMSELLRTSISNYRNVVVCAKRPGTEPLTVGMTYAGFGRIRDNVFARRHVCYVSVSGDVYCSADKGLLKGLNKRFNIYVGQKNLLPPYQSGFD